MGGRAERRVEEEVEDGKGRFRDFRGMEVGGERFGEV